MRKVLLFSLSFLVLFAATGAASDDSALERPFLIGPHYPLAYQSTTFEPDRAFNLKAGQTFVQTSFTRLNTYAFSENSDKSNNPTGDPSQFNSTLNQGYSVYFDGEIDRRFFRWYQGLSDGTELQITYRDLRFIAGGLDSQIEGFHKALGIGNQGRDQTARDQLQIYIHDNQTGENILAITEGSDHFQRESMTFGLKFRVRETANEAIALVISSNFSDGYVQGGMNETGTLVQADHKNFNDSNISLLYSSKFTDWTLHAGFSLARVSQSLLPKAPDEMYYFFLGSDITLGDHSHFLLQALEYTSPFPEDNVSTISADIREVSTGFRWIFGPTAFELGLIENQSQGPQNIDIAYFSNFMLSF